MHHSFLVSLLSPLLENGFHEDPCFVPCEGVSTQNGVEHIVGESQDMLVECIQILSFTLQYHSLQIINGATEANGLESPS